MPLHLSRTAAIESTVWATKCSAAISSHQGWSLWWGSLEPCSSPIGWSARLGIVTIHLALVSAELYPSSQRSEPSATEPTSEPCASNARWRSAWKSWCWRSRRSFGGRSSSDCSRNPWSANAASPRHGSLSAVSARARLSVSDDAVFGEYCRRHWRVVWQYDF